MDPRWVGIHIRNEQHYRSIDPSVIPKKVYNFHLFTCTCRVCTKQFDSKNCRAKTCPECREPKCTTE